MKKKVPLPTMFQFAKSKTRSNKITNKQTENGMKAGKISMYGY